MSIISSKHRLVKVSSENIQYSAGPGIVIEDYNISVDPNLSAVIDDKLDTSTFSSYSATIDEELQYVSANAGNTYSAGDNIDIYEQDNDLYISAKDWTTDIANASSYAFNEATAQIPPEFDPTYISGQIDNKLNKSDFDTYSGSVNTQITGLSGEVQTTSSILSAAVDYLSGNAGKTYTGISPIVVNNTTNKISADTQDISFGTGLAFTGGVLSVTAQGGDPEVESVVKTNSADWGTITALSSTSSLLDNKITAVRNDLNTVTTNTGYLHTDIQTTSGILSAAIDYVSANVGDEFPASANEAITAYQTYSGTYATTGDINSTSSILSGAIDYVSANLPDPYTGVYHDDNFSGNGKSTPLGIALHSTIAGNDIYGGPTIKLSGSDKEIMNIGSTQISLWHPASGVGGGATYSYINGDGLDFTYNAGSYYLRTLKTTNSGLMIYNRGSVASSYLDGKGLYVWDGANVESAGFKDIQKWNSVYNDVTTASGGWGGGTSLTGDAQGAVDEVYSNSADWNSNYSTVNANSGTWTNGGFTGEVYGISGVSPNVNVYIDQNTLWISAAAGGAGNPEVESYVQTNSASIDEVVSTYETNSGTYLTAHQDISNKLDTTAFSTVSGTFLTAHQPISANEWNSVYDTVESNSGSWAGGGGSIDTIPVAVISPLVTGFSGESAYLGIESTALNLSSYVPVSAIGVNFQGYVSGISGMYISAINSRNAGTANFATTADRAYKDRNSNEITSYYQPKLTIAGDAGTITAINGSAVGATIPEGWELVGSAGISIFDDSENNQTIISVTGGGDLSNYYTKTETSSKIELNNAIGNIETLLANL